MNFTKQIGVKFYCIRNKQGDYWSNDFGWMELVDEAEEFPIEGFWEIC